MGRQHPSDAKDTDCHGPYGPRNDSVFTTACVYLGAKPYRYVIARERSDRGNPFSLILHFAFCILHFVRQHDKSQFAGLFVGSVGMEAALFVFQRCGAEFILEFGNKTGTIRKAGQKTGLGHRVVRPKKTL